MEQPGPEHKYLPPYISTATTNMPAADTPSADACQTSDTTTSSPTMLYTTAAAAALHETAVVKPWTPPKSHACVEPTTSYILLPPGKPTTESTDSP